MTATKIAILRTLLYFDIFRHPLNKSELFRLAGMKSKPEEFEQSLNELIDNNLVGHEAEYFFTINGESIVNERINKLYRSGKYHRISRFISGLIYYHPFVRGVFVSGSLSKSSFTKNDDIDFFIIAEPGRIWLCRTILMLFKKVFLLNSEKYFCINYFIDTETLEIQDKNIFTATEIAFLIPLRNYELCQKFFVANDWIHTFFPNLSIDLNGCRKASSPFFKRFQERLLRGRYGDKLDSFFMELYRKRSRRKFGFTDNELFRINFKSEKNVAKYHPNGFQQLVLQSYLTKISEFQTAHKVDLTL
jgi:hypothetical protein